MILINDKMLIDYGSWEPGKFQLVSELWIIASDLEAVALKFEHELVLN